MDNSFKSEMATVLGFYDFVNQPTVVSPWHVSGMNPEVTEVHEGMHRDLANTTSTGVVTKIFARILSQRSKLPDSLATNIASLLDVLLQETFLPHEATATYASFKVFFHNAPGAAATQLPRLPTSYRSAMAILEPLMGPVNDAAGDLIIQQPLLLAVAKVALSPPLFAEFDDFPQFTSLRRFIQNESPNKRFQRLVESLLTSDGPTLLSSTREHFTGLLGGAVESASLVDLLSFLPTVNQKILEKVATIAAKHDIKSAVDVDGLLQYMRTLISVLNSHLAREGVDVLSNVRIRDTRKLGLVATASIDYMVPSTDDNVLANYDDARTAFSQMTGLNLPAASEAEIRSLMPKDTSLRLPWKLYDAERGIERVKNIDETTGKLFFNISPMRMEGRPLLYMSIGAYSIDGVDWSTTKPQLEGANSNAFSFTTDLFAFLEMMEQLRSKKYIVKIDERFLIGFPEVAAVLRKLAFPLVVMLHDSTSEHIDSVITDEIARAATIHVTFIGLGLLSVIIIGNNTDNQYLMSPIAVTGFELLLRYRLEKDPRIDVLSEGTPPRLGDIGIDITLLRELLYSSYLL